MQRKNTREDYQRSVDPGNYRPVSLTCVACKLLESFVRLRDAMVEHMMDKNLYAECQHGFLKHILCVTQLLRGYGGYYTANW